MWVIYGGIIALNSIDKMRSLSNIWDAKVFDTQLHGITRLRKYACHVYIRTQLDWDWLKVV